MARTIGTPLTRTDVKLHIPEDCVMKQGRRRYVFVDVLSPKIRQLSFNVFGSKKLYESYHKILYRELYNMKAFYGLRAIDIDKPMLDGIDVSVQLEIIVGEGEDSCSRALWEQQERSAT
jgi:hypothetical protein